MGSVLSAINPFRSATVQNIQVPEMPNTMYRQFVEEKFLDLITKANTLGTVIVGRTKVMDAIKSGTYGLVFIAGGSPYARYMPVTQLCTDNEMDYHVFSSGRKVQDIIKTNSNVLMVINHSSYYGLYDLCRTGMDILSDQ